MEEEATPKTERSSAASSSQNLPGDANEILVPSFSPPASPTPTGTGTLTRLGMSLRAQAAGGAAGGPGGGQVSAITVVALLDKLVNMLESVQENQQRMEQRQAELEGAVRTVQGDVTRLSKVHLNTANNVNKLLERSRKVGGGVKEVKERLDKQAVQVKRLENNHAHLLKRNHFKVVITQEDNEIPTDVFVRDSMKTPLPPFDEEGSVSGSMAGSMAAPSVCGSVAGSVAASVAPSVDMRSPEECLQNVSLTSDEDDDQATHRELLAEIDADSTTGSAFGRTYERRADRFKRNSLKKVDSLKKAFTRQNIEKKVNQITTKIVPPEKREKIIKSFSPNHPKSPTAKNSSFKVTPMTFNVKKTRDGEMSTPETSPSYAPETSHSYTAAHVEIPSLGSLDAKRPLQALRDAAEAAEAASVDAMAQVREALNEVSVGAEISVNGDVNGDDHSAADERSAGDASEQDKQVLKAAGEAVGSAGLAVPESVDDIGEDEEEESPAEGAAAEPDATASIPTAGIALEQAS